MLPRPEAEIIWWPQFDDLNGDGALTPDETVTRVLHRRVLVVRPDLNAAGGPWFTLNSAFNAGNPYNVSNQGGLQSSLRTCLLYNRIDVSVRLVRVLNGSNLTVQVYANSLTDLTRPENRFLRHPMVLKPGAYQFVPSQSLPYAIDTNPQHDEAGVDSAQRRSAGRGCDLVVVLAFDVRAYDPTVVWPERGGLSLVPSDNGWDARDRGRLANRSWRVRGLVLQPAVFPASWNVSGRSILSEAPQTKSGITAAGEQPFYDTWSFHFEQNGLDENGDGIADEGTDELDNDGANGTDDPGERETSPPYPVALRGIQTILPRLRAGHAASAAIDGGVGIRTGIGRDCLTTRPGSRYDSESFGSQRSRRIGTVVVSRFVDSLPLGLEALHRAAG